jgi:Response regulators consisting of a CheY-like receiver domain and a winged-helix DNA-binding domain
MSNKILIADDSKLVVALVRNIFENEQDGYTVISSMDGKDALAKAEKELPDIILMDWQMPEMTGIEALKLLKENEITKSIPVLMLTASESTNEAFECGATDFIQKPFNKTELIARVKTSLELVNALKDLKLKSVDLEIQHNKLKIQKDILVRQKKELSEFHEIALKLSQINSPEQTNYDKIFPEYFVYALPVNEIPSNFIWTVRKGKFLLICVGYSSNFGFASVVFSSGIISALNIFVNDIDNEIDLQPSQIMTFINEKFKSSVEQAVSGKNANDLVICSIDLEKRLLQYSGINIPLYVIKNNKLVELKTDKNKFGIVEKSIEFTNHKVRLAKGDLIYILNDGFNERKASHIESSYISEELIKIINKIFKKDLFKQKELLDKTFKLWKKDLKQVNDILALGIKV